MSSAGQHHLGAQLSLQHGIVVKKFDPPPCPELHSLTSVVSDLVQMKTSLRCCSPRQSAPMPA